MVAGKLDRGGVRGEGLDHDLAGALMPPGTPGDLHDQLCHALAGTEVGTEQAVVGIEDAGQRIADFREVEKGFTEEEGRREATRCLRCDLEKEENAI